MEKVVENIGERKHLIEVQRRQCINNNTGKFIFDSGKDISSPEFEQKVKLSTK